MPPRGASFQAEGPGPQDAQRVNRGVTCAHGPPPRPPQAIKQALHTGVGWGSHPLARPIPPASPGQVRHGPATWRRTVDEEAG